MSLEVIILAAGKGTRMYSDLPKVLHPLAGQAMLTRVIEAAEATGADKIHVVTGFQSEMVRNHYQDSPYNDRIHWVEQTEQLGTGHAVSQALPAVDPDNQVLVLYGDVPLLEAETLTKLVAACGDSGIAVLTLDTANPAGLGRIVRNNKGDITEIVEEKDANIEQKAITEINTGIMAFSAAKLKAWLEKTNTNNAQGEYYLTDTVAMACADGLKVSSLTTEDEDSVQGVNNRLQLAELERRLQRKQAEQIASNGTTVLNLDRVEIRGHTTFGKDVVIDINVILEGDNHIGDRVRIGPNTVIKNSRIGSDTCIEAFSHLEDCEIQLACQIGPYARLRPGTVLCDKAKIGNFVETKKTVIGKGSKVNHLSYIGDAQVDEAANVGAGTITCNYDGVNKYKTHIKSNAFIGSNTALVAPVTVGMGATTGAGSVITSDIPDGQLAIGRGKQRNIPNWKRPTKKTD
ncbi:bifunctional UDP-N-acetylglucosamine diphosphorylase/glucosamine-1-phosphate N-acetyltransferase GlmU [Pseudohongiella nitratireducens]|nr:bifunctional UDP-N-acetylglucosamine diphosphorylase/glucosamine-1-phosphate N-acetyltransferase GlmU [Pseudohongiella nitratireducens]MDF1624426.1 bifunctional UDP-N-acetylglucosamine diphosphorylase/glucosamine-1-phosphate N-acetyltransferase GlmU [Pseudohongiella nitratireducens]